VLKTPKYLKFITFEGKIKGIGFSLLKKEQELGIFSFG